jgi:recombination associated protein RdgC
MFRNIRLYRLRSPWPDSEAALSAQLENAAFKPCGPYTERSSGWESATGDPQQSLARRVGGADLLRLRTQVRLLPAAAITEALEDRLVEFRARAQRDPSRREKLQLKDEVQAELMPKTLVKSQRTRGFCLLAENLIGVETTSEAQAERFLDTLRAALGSLQVTPIAFKKAPGELLTKIFLGSGPGEFRSGRECRMEDPAAGATTVTWLDADLHDPSVTRHVRDGLKLTRLGVEFADLLSCVIDQDCVIRKLKMQGLESVDDMPDEDPLARLDAEFVLLTGNVRRLVRSLEKPLGGLD